jgi:hypothetical protein
MVNWRNNRTLRFTFGLLLTTALGQQFSPALAQDAAASPRPDLFASPSVPGELDLTPEQSSRLERYRADRAAGAVTIVRLAADALERAEHVNLNIAPGRDLPLDRKRLSQRAARDYSWSAAGTPARESALAARDTTEVALVVKGDAVVGTVRAGGQLYRIRPLGQGLSALIQVDASRMPPEHPKGQERSPEAPGGEPERDMPTAQQDDCGSYDVMVAYTPDARTEAGDIDALIQLAIDETNQGYAASGATTRANLVQAYQASYAGTGSVGTDLDRLSSPGDGYLDEVNGLRDRHGADVAILLTGSSDACGVAYLNPSAGSAFGVVAENCATGYYSFAHEIGHIQGARHNAEIDPASTPFAYGHGFYYPAQHWRTIMSYDCPGGCTRLNSWSNPDKTRNGVTMGSTGVQDNARVLNETACRVAGFRSHAGGGTAGGSTGGASGPSWRGWETLLAGIKTTPECRSTGGQQIDCWAVRSDSRITWSRWDGTSWRSWRDLGGATASPPSCVEGSGRLSCFIVGMDSQLQQSAYNGSYWSGWTGRGGSLRGQPSCVADSTGAIQCFARGTDSRLWQIGSDAGGWKAPASLGGQTAQRPACYPRGSGIDCYIVDSGYRMQVTRYARGGWSGFESAGGSLQSPPSCVFDGARTRCFARGRDGTLQTVQHDGRRWNAWSSLGGPVQGEPSCFPFGGGKLACLARGASGGLVDKRFDGTAWKPFNQVRGSVAGRPAAVVPTDNRIELFVRAGDGSLRHNTWR